MQAFLGLVVDAGFGWMDPDADILFTGDLASSAKVEARLSGPNGECVLILAGSVLNFPGETSGSVSAGGPTFRQDIAQAGEGMGSVTLIDAAQNRGNTLTAMVQAEPRPGACDPAEPLVFTF